MILKSLPRFGRLAVSIVFGIVIFSGLCFAANFTATSSMKQDGITIYGKLYVKGENMRQEMTIGGKNQVLICRADKNVTWLLDPSQKCYSEVPGAQNERTMHDSLKKMGKEKYLGKETLNGYSCKKYKYTMSGKNATTVIQWRSEKLNWPLKTEIKNGGKSMVIEYKNIKEVKPADSLFELPKGYKKKAFDKEDGKLPFKDPKQKAPSAAKQPKK